MLRIILSIALLFLGASFYIYKYNPYAILGHRYLNHIEKYKDTAFFIKRANLEKATQDTNYLYIYWPDYEASYAGEVEYKQGRNLVCNSDEVLLYVGGEALNTFNDQEEINAKDKLYESLKADGFRAYRILKYFYKDKYKKILTNEIKTNAVIIKIKILDMYKLENLKYVRNFGYTYNNWPDIVTDCDTPLFK